jgi:virginiamycin B lyase
MFKYTKKRIKDYQMKKIHGVIVASAAAGFLAVFAFASGRVTVRLEEYPVPEGSHPHDVAPAGDGKVWYTAQHAGSLGWFDPGTGKGSRINLGEGSSPHGVIVGPDGSPWVTDSGLNAILRLDPVTEKISVYPLPNTAGHADLNTAAFDRDGTLWFTGQRGVYGRLDPRSGRLDVYEAPGGRGPYGITASPDGRIYYVSLAAGHLAEVDTKTGKVEVFEPPRKGAGTRRVWADSKGVLWITGWYSGTLFSYDTKRGRWREIALPGGNSRPYAVYVDETDAVWVSDFSSNAVLRYDQETGKFDSFELPSAGSEVRQMLGREGEVWGAESGTDRLVVLKFTPEKPAGPKK